MKIIGYFDSRCVDMPKKIEVIEMAAGFLRAMLSDGNVFELHPDVIEAYTVADRSLDTLQTLTKVLEILNLAPEIELEES